VLLGRAGHPLPTIFPEDQSSSENSDSEEEEEEDDAEPELITGDLPTSSDEEDEVLTQPDPLDTTVAETSSERNSP